MKTEKSKRVFEEVKTAVLDYLGDADEETYQITLYDVPNKAFVINAIKKSIERITKRYCLIVLSPKEAYTNIKILNIDL